MFDAIVVGGRVAGASTALLLARKGFRVLVVDKARFPAEIPHGHFIHRHGPRRLQKWGLLERIVATGCPPSTTFTIDTGEIRLSGRDLVLDGVAFGYGPRGAHLTGCSSRRLWKRAPSFAPALPCRTTLSKETASLASALRTASRAYPLKSALRSLSAQMVGGRGRRAS